MSSVPWQVARSAEEHHPGFDPSVLSLTLTLYRAMSSFDRAGTAELAPHGLTISQLNILSVLHRVNRPLTMGELGHAVSVRPANLTGVVDALTRRGLVERRVNPDDRRSYLVTNTSAGEQLLADFLPGHWQYLGSVTDGLSTEERLELTRLLERLRESADAAMRALDHDGRTPLADRGT
jgi:DNA-binding MarR family transcriptional regulator